MDTGIWQQFTLDPRSTANADVRASNADREVALSALGSAYAEGMLTMSEHDERGTAVTNARTLGEVAAPLRDLVPAAADRTAATKPPTTAIAPAQEAAACSPLTGGAVGPWAAALSTAIICWTIWLFTTPGGFPWPIFPTLGTLVAAVTKSGAPPHFRTRKRLTS